MGYPICALRPTGVYGLAQPPARQQVVRFGRCGRPRRTVDCQRGGKEVHAADVAQAVELLLNAPADKVAGEAFNCYDRYMSEWEVAHLAKQISGSQAEIRGQQTSPKNQIVTEKLRSLGMTFGGQQLLETTVAQLVEAVRSK